MKQHMIHRKNQSGQAILLIAMLMVALVASLGLAIDGGGMFLMYRDVQNATDAAALSAAFALCTGSDAEDAARDSAELNGFIHGVDNAEVIVEWPPTSASTANTAYHNTNYIAIEIKDTKPSYFIQVVYNGPMVVSATTISKCQPESQFGWPSNSSTISLSQGCAAGNGNTAPNRTTGGSSYETVGGGIYINSSNCADGGANTVGGSSVSAGGYGMCSQGTNADVSGNGSITATEGGTITNDCGPDYPQITDPDPLRTAGLTPPACGPAQSFNNGGTNSPGTYSTFDPTSGTTTLLSGIYCITDGDMDLRGGLYTDPTNGGVFLYFQNTVDLSANSNGWLELHAINDPDSDYKGLLMWWADDTTPSNSTDVTFNAQVSGALSGTIYAPYKHCNFAGQTGIIVYAQFICYSFDNNGGSGVEIHFNPALIYTIPAEFGITE